MNERRGFAANTDRRADMSFDVQKPSHPLQREIERNRAMIQSIKSERMYLESSGKRWE